ncbi:kinesin-like protein KIN-7O isoform X2 [Herrania umbratica]|uniref:Kinesin-like protein KIN-7O isoform X2 n=1 Tax=Herrania umbratica TaxID=108875 RepID=A0A6J1BEA6_9ROSI|nr:kinesin-like protein KIN-7O isoform X2 [Herrania umbratica]
MERIHVAVRTRPLFPEDAKTSPWKISANSIFIPNHSTKFEFDQIFGEDCKTGEVYEARTKEIVAAAVRGFNGTVFAYGQTNSGKTHTMRGSAAEPGVIPLAVHDLFGIIQQDVDREFLLRMSYMEIYNEEIIDLLAPEHRKLQIHESIERGIYVAGLREEIVASPQQALDFMEFGESHRHIGETNMNLHSSRSHTIFRMIIESRDRTEDGDGDAVDSCDAVRVSVLNLVDLAGSERAAKTGAEGVRLKEGSHINKSLMTLGTVIKKLSEGAESQGGHVPYRDSKLTRILQPALGGNANTAIICNITLAQIHADETKSSLQFASRALRVTNCARVNEILTDAALLKRQKKEIEELRAKLQGSRSEHLEKEILNLRNTLLQSELERERIALELEEEKKAQVERERVLQEQAKKIKNLSSMVLYSSRDESRDQFKKEKRRDTWCPGNLAREALREAYSSVQSNSSAIKPTKSLRNMGPLLSFEELVDETEISDDLSKQDEDCKASVLEDCTLPDPCALLHVTNRRKVLPRKKSSFVEDSELLELQTEYEDLLLNFETQRTMSEIQIDCLMRKLAEADSLHNMKHIESNDHSAFHANKTNCADKNIGLREFEAILVIKQLQEKIKILETEKSSSQQNLNSLVELATEQNICAREKFDELCQELLNAREEARVAREKLAHSESGGRKDKCMKLILSCDFAIKLLKEVEDLISEAQESKEVVQSLSSLVDDAFQSFSAIIQEFLDFNGIMCENSVQQKIIIANTEKLHSCMRQRTSELENDKKQVQELMEDAQNHEASLMALSEEHDWEKSQYLSQIQSLEKEISYLSSCSLAREKESLRKDFEKTKLKLQDTECKLKNTIQEKTKLEGEKAFAEREIKRLHGQKTLLERDISKRDSLAGRRRDSVFDRNSKMFDPKKAKALEQTMQEDYKKLEILAFEMETTIASLEEELASAHRDKVEAISRNEDLALAFEALTKKFNITSSEMNALQEELSGLRLSLEQSNSNQQEMESSIKRLLAEKEELAMQLTSSLLEMEEERAIQSAREKASITAIEENTKLYNSEITSLSETLSEVMKELESCKKECDVLREKLTYFDENATLEKKWSMQKSLQIDQLKNDVETADAKSKQSEQISKSNFEILSSELQHAQEELSIIKREREDLSAKIGQLVAKSDFSDELQKLKNQLLDMSRERDKLVTQVEEQQSSLVEVEMLKQDSNDVLMEAKFEVEELTSRLSCMEAKMHNDQVNNGKEMAKHRMRLRGTQAQLDALRYRYKQAVEESDIMNRKFEEASANLKERLASKGIEVLNLKKQLAAASGQ